MPVLGVKMRIKNIIYMCITILFHIFFSLPAFKEGEKVQLAGGLLKDDL